MAIFKNNPPVVTNGLVLYLDVANRQSYTSGSATWYDLSGLGNNTIVTASRFESDSIRITGSTDTQPILTTIITLTTSSNWSFNIVFKSDTTSPSTSYFRLFDDGGTGLKYLKLEWNNRVLSSAGFFFNGFTPSCSLNRNYNDLTFTCVQGTGSIYLNGIKTTYNSLQTSDLVINRLGIAQNTIDNGNIATFKIYDRALTPQEITQNYNATKARFNLT